MSHTIYQNDCQYRSWELVVQSRDRRITKPTVASGTYTLLGPSGEIMVPATLVSVTSPNIVSFFIQPSSGSATIGEFSEVWHVWIGSENFTKQETLYIRERF